jgi:hypothetical protein
VSHALKIASTKTRSSSSAEGRQAFRERLPVGEMAWARGRGWALWKTLATCAYTLGNDDQEAANARRILGEIFSEYTAGSTVPPHPCPAPTVH